MRVDNIIIAYQKEPSENMNQLLRIAGAKKIPLATVSAGDKLVLENQIEMDILWPDKNHFIEENAINNNSLVCKLNYQNVSVLFTGDIEKIAEEAISRRFQEEIALQATILKVAHHGSHSSTSSRWLERVKPKIALIGVGEKNAFGHPNQDVLERLDEKGIRIYRTDCNGEVLLKIEKEISVFTKLK